MFSKQWHRAVVVLRIYLVKSPQQKLKEWSCLHIDSNEINFIFEDENMFDVYSFTGRVIDPVGVNFNVMNLNWP